ncbi:MAG: hypothetical protein QOG44_1065, partial [Acidimicrobiaceae bacterium]|nr:hypothetical protein [Acidimicrobiaceae bacterium]
GESQTNNGVVATSNSGRGLSGTSQSNTAVFGVSTTGRGVEGYAESGYGVYGQSKSSSGVRGTSVSARGVEGWSTSNSGLFGISDTGWGVEGSSKDGRGVSGGSGSNTGVFGESKTGRGVEGYANAGFGVYGESQTWPGVRGTSVSNNGAEGWSTSAAGLFGTSDKGDGVRGETHSPTAAAIRGVNPGGIAGWFQGDLYVTGVFHMVDGADFAEDFSVVGDAPVEPGMVVVLDDSGGVRICDRHLHRRFFQRLHRTPRDEIAGDRNCDNMEIYASSPSYLITAGGEPAPWALFPDIQGIFAPDEAAKQLGVAVTTSFMPTFLVPRTDPVFPDPRPLATNHAISGNDAAGLIQFGAFSSNTKEKVGPFAHTIVATPVANYGVAPDFACGHQMYLPDWVSREIIEGFADGVPRDPHSQGWSFVNMGSDPRQPGPGFFLALFRDGEYAVLEAYDTWLHRPRADDARAISFKQFKESVERRNGALSLSGNKVTAYTTENGTEVEFVIWDNHERRGAFTGAEVLSIRRYGDRFDALGDAGNVRDRFVNGTILNSPAPPAEAVVEISNPNLSTRLTLDFSDQRHPRRVSESGEVEVAGYHNEVWADFEWGGAEEGDAYRPFRTLKAAVAAAAPGGSVRIVPGQSAERVVIDKRPLRLVAPIGGVAVGTPAPRKVADPDPAAGAIDDRSVWVQFDSPDPNTTDPARPFNTVKAAIAVVAPRGVINVLPGSTLERITLTKRVTLVAPIGGVSIGALQLHW